MIRALFGAKGQLAVGAITLLISVAIWAYGYHLIRTNQREALLDLLFHASMFYGCVACYSIIATALGYRATERVEEVVVAQAETVEVESAGKVEVNR